MVDLDAGGVTGNERPPEPAAAETSRPRGPSIGNTALQLVTITAGVLIALFFEGLVGWNKDRTLVEQARSTIAREMAFNKKEVDGKLAAQQGAVQRLDSALRMADELLTTKKTGINELNIGLSLAELQAVSWRSAERAGALALMDFAEVLEYSRVYDLQELYAEHQRRSVEKLSAAISIVYAGDPHRASSADLELFRRQVLALRSDVVLEENFLKRLSELYQSTLNRRSGGQDGRSDSPPR